MKKLVILAGFIWMWSLSISSQAAISCSDWPGRDFFESASAQDVRDCLAEGASLVSRGDDGRTPLHWAVAVSSNVAVIAELLTAGADPSLTDSDGHRAIHLAAAEGRNPTVISYLVAWGGDAQAEVSGKGGRCPRSLRRCADVPLHLAAVRPDGADFVASLLAAGANVDARDEDGSTALYHAAANATDAMTINLLLHAGASADIADLKGLTALHMATQQCESAMETIPVLLSAGASADQRDEEGVTPLMWGARFACDSDIVMLLLQASESPCAEDDRERTVFHQWERNANLERDDVYWTLHDRCMN